MPRFEPPDPASLRSTAAGLSDEALNDLLAEVRTRVGELAGSDAMAYEGALSALEAEAAARGLMQAAPRERRPVAVARRRLSERLRTGSASQLLELVPDLDPRGLFAIFRFSLDRLEPADRLQVLEALFTRLDELHYDPPVAHRRRHRYLRPDLPLARRIERVRKAVAFQFRTLHRLESDG